ncbi:hypothetical protein E2562_019043 [Oryza meyeriana var. granulata]|uniref:Uncharacterized protein n=1 Tax=Oryza meyeriana var. granulata TaxID=110450 RepID=A0A6G1EN05_9ORYZ|nr:hypothetical protein E2562_019043 [Oryza meyeriana var. granulata]
MPLSCCCHLCARTPPAPLEAYCGREARSGVTMEVEQAVALAAEGPTPRYPHSGAGCGLAAERPDLLRLNDRVAGAGQ